jgi:hypothetical protein
MVSNTATVNEETDPSLVIKALKQQVCELKDQVKLLQVCTLTSNPFSQMSCAFNVSLPGSHVAAQMRSQGSFMLSMEPAGW